MHCGLLLKSVMNSKREWNHLCLQDYKSIVDYNHVIYKICSKLKFCEKEATYVNKIVEHSIYHASS